MLKSVYAILLKNFTNNTDLIHELWNEVEMAYSAPHRHYHNLHHINHLFDQLHEHATEIRDEETMAFSVFYHDIVYVPGNSDNEDKSAELAIEHMKKLKAPSRQIDKCVDQILATKNHTYDVDHDTNLFTDADLSILGMPTPKYDDYRLQIREEFVEIPYDRFATGRQKLLQKMLDKSAIYKTLSFREKLEAQARENMQHELLELS